MKRINRDRDIESLRNGNTVDHACSVGRSIKSFERENKNSLGSTKWPIVTYMYKISYIDMMQFDLYIWRHQRTLAKHLLIGPNCVSFLEATNKNCVLNY